MRSHPPAMRQIAAFCLGLAALAVSACTETLTTHGHVLKPEDVAALKVGEQSKQTVEALLGTPSSVSLFDDNVWYYISDLSRNKPLNPNILETRDVYILTFDDTGTLADVSKRDKAASKEVDPNTASTYTQGQSLGIIDQFLFNLGRGL
jgi:outer membrane protein assembly factor BamE (lipoprotein component of BamABCDE complex)